MRATCMLAGAVAVAPLLLAACGGGSSSSPPPTSGVLGARTSIHRVTVTETEYKLSLSQTDLQPGTVTFVAQNKGHIQHSLEIDGPGVSDTRIASSLAPGSSKTLVVTLKRGTYELYCPIDGHKQLGMETKVSVGGAVTLPTTSTPATSTSSSGGGY